MDDMNTNDGYAVKLSAVKAGDYVKRTASANAVYIRGDYDRASKCYSLIDTEDHCREIFIKGDKIVYIGFTY